MAVQLREGGCQTKLSGIAGFAPPEGEFPKGESGTAPQNGAARLTPLGLRDDRSCPGLGIASVSGGIQGLGVTRKARHGSPRVFRPHRRPGRPGSHRPHRTPAAALSPAPGVSALATSPAIAVAGALSVETRSEWAPGKVTRRNVYRDRGFVPRWAALRTRPREPCRFVPPTGGASHF